MLVSGRFVFPVHTHIFIPQATHKDSVYALAQSNTTFLNESLRAKINKMSVRKARLRSVLVSTQSGSSFEYALSW